MGRAPCCDKSAVKKGPWSPEEDAILKSYIHKHGTGGNWIALPQKIGLKRCGKSCRLRWLNYLRPNIRHGGFTDEEDYIICSLYLSIGSRWSIIASQLPGRTDNDIKNYWNTRLKKKLLGKQGKASQQDCFNSKQETALETSVQTLNRIHTENQVFPQNIEALNPSSYNGQDFSSFYMEEQASQGQENPTKYPIETMFSWEPSNSTCLGDAASYHYYGSSKSMNTVASSSPSMNSVSSSTNSSLQAYHFDNINDDQEIFTGFENLPTELLDHIVNNTTEDAEYRGVQTMNNAGDTVPMSTSTDQSNHWDDIGSIVDYPYD